MKIIYIFIFLCVYVCVCMCMHVELWAHLPCLPCGCQSKNCKSLHQLSVSQVWTQVTCGDRFLFSKLPYYPIKNFLVTHKTIGKFCRMLYLSNNLNYIYLLSCPNYNQEEVVAYDSAFSYVYWYFGIISSSLIFCFSTMSSTLF